MSLSGLINNFNKGPLRAAKESLKKLSECDDSYLSILFESKENINLCILELLSIEKNECNLNEKLENQKKNLLDTLSLKMDDLFDEFYDRYCKRTITVDEFRNSIILKDALKDTDDKKLADMYDSVCLDIAKIIFATITKCDIVKFMKNVKADPEVLESVISKFIDKSIESEFSAAIDIERDLLNKDKAENEKIIIKHFGSQSHEYVKTIFDGDISEFKSELIGKLKNKLHDQIINSVNEYETLDFHNFMICINNTCIKFFGSSYIRDEFIKHCFKYIEERIGNDSDKSNLSGSEDNTKDDEYIANELGKEKIGNLLDKIGGTFMKDEFFHFKEGEINTNISKLIKPIGEKLFSMLDANDLAEIMRDTETGMKYLGNTIDEKKNELYDSVLESFMTNAKNLYFDNCMTNIDLPKEERETIVRQVQNEYPNGEKKIGWNILGAGKWKEYKQTFFKKKAEEFIKNLKETLENNRDEILNLPHDDMLMLFGALMQEIRYLELNLDNELRDDVLNYLRNEFEKSQLKKESKSKLLQQIKQQGSTTKKVEKEETSSILESQINRKKNSIELSDQIIEDLVEYFGHDVDKKLERSLRNCGGEYKKSYFVDFGVDEIFFEILDKHGFICIDIEEVEHENNIEETKSVLDIEGNQNPEKERSAEMIRLDKIIEILKNTEGVEEKVGLYMEALKLFYDFEDEERINGTMLNFCKNDVRILKGIKSILERISKGQKEDLVTAKSQINRYFTFDLGYNTGYRLVLQDQKNSDRRIILDLCDHDYYEQHIDRYMKYNN